MLSKKIGFFVLFSTQLALAGNEGVQRVGFLAVFDAIALGIKYSLGAGNGGNGPNRPKRTREEVVNEVEQQAHQLLQVIRAVLVEMRAATDDLEAQIARLTRTQEAHTAYFRFVNGYRVGAGQAGPLEANGLLAEANMIVNALRAVQAAAFSDELASPEEQANRIFTEADMIVNTPRAVQAAAAATPVRAAAFWDELASPEEQANRISTEIDILLEQSPVRLSVRLRHIQQTLTQVLREEHQDTRIRLQQLQDEIHNIAGQMSTQERLVENDGAPLDFGVALVPNNGEILDFCIPDAPQKPSKPKSNRISKHRR